MILNHHFQQHLHPPQHLRVLRHRPVLALQQRQQQHRHVII